MPHSQITNYITGEACLSIRQHIAAAEGNEVFFVGRLNEEKVVEQVQVYARGNEFSAPALLQTASPGDVVLHNHPSGTLLPSTPDTHVASILGNDGIGFYIVNNAVDAIYVVVEPFEKKQVIPINADAAVRLFAADGRIAERLESYEHRKQQIEMLRIVSGAINENKIAVVEAGTGTGKTLAYLLPAIVFALNNQERVVVSTNTINLQEQLLDKDLPFLQSILDKKFTAALVKGRTNYACRRKLADADMDLDLFSEDDDKTELQAILDWARTTADGSKSDLNIEPRHDVWEKIQSESDTSLKTHCPFYDTCFFYTARRKAAVADVLVANHHLLFSDLAVRAMMGASENAILPTYERVIFDEAHHIEEVATSYFGIRVTSLGVQRMLSKLYRKKKKQEKGLLVYLSNRLVKFASGLPHADFLEAQKRIQEFAIPAAKNLQSSLEETVRVLHDAVKAGSEERQGFGEVKLRITQEVIESQDWQNGVVRAASELVQNIRNFTTRMSQFLARIERLLDKMGPTAAAMTIDLKAQLDRLDVVATNIDHVVLNFDDPNVRWLEAKDGYNDKRIIRLFSSPLDVAPILAETVYKRFQSIVLTSATLTVENKFDYFKKRLGLDRVEPERLVLRQLAQPFDYKRQALLAIPVDLPHPNQVQFTDQIAEMTHRAVRISRGRAFVLFTAYGMLRKVYDLLRDKLEAEGYHTLRQGEENRSRLLKRFREDISSVLFATDSFWEGVDVHGEALELVVITKLPFRVPSEPIIEARIEAIERRGGNAFLEYTVPQAAIKFKQGFGRLIRRKTDRGAILILDKRLVEKSYGRIFMNSLPPCSTAVGRAGVVLQALTDFYEAGVAESSSA